MTYRAYTDDELAACLGMRVKRTDRSDSFLMITEILGAKVFSRTFGWITAEGLVASWLDLSTGQPCGMLDLEKGELPR